MGSSEKFCLRWNDFESNISVAFREIREEKDFFDCTLSCGSRQIQAHKLILSACSPFFRSILRQNPHQHPLLYLKGVEFTDLQAVLNFMYHGEVNVAQEELNSFLSVAEDLKVKGLTQNNSEVSTNNEQSKPQKTKAEPISVPSSRPRPTNTEDQTQKRPRYTAAPAAPSAPAPYPDDDIQEVMPVVKQEPPSQVVEHQPHPQPVVTMSQAAYQPTMVQGNTVAQVEESYGEDGYDYGGYEEEGGGYEVGMMDQSIGGPDHNKVISDVDDVDSFIQSSSSLLESGEWLCCLCQKVVRNKGNLVQHIEVNHLARVARYPCTLCGDKFVTRRKLARHRKNECREALHQLV